MVKYIKILLVLILTVSAVPAFSDMAPTVSVVSEKLADQGYRVSRITKTFWGRVKIISRKDDLEREVILNPNTGEILRDLVRRLRHENSGSGRQGAASGSDKDDDRSDDDDSDRDDRDDDTSDDGDSDSDDGDDSDSSGSSDSSDDSDDDD